MSIYLQNLSPNLLYIQEINSLLLIISPYVKGHFLSELFAVNPLWVMGEKLFDWITDDFIFCTTMR